jgi:hypothetical protein
MGVLEEETFEYHLYKEFEPKGKRSWPNLSHLYYYFRFGWKYGRKAQNILIRVSGLWAKISTRTP